MRKRLSEISACKVSAVEGPVGLIDDLLLENDGWNVRYLVVHLRRSSSFRPALISTAAIEGFGVEQTSFRTNLRKVQLDSSPEIGEPRSISRQHEELLVQHFGWPIYWLGRQNSRQRNQAFQIGNPDAKLFVREDGSPNLRSASTLIGYEIWVQDRLAGRLQDLIINLNSWTVDLATADRDSIPFVAGSMFSMTRMEHVDWAGGRVYLNANSAAPPWQSQSNQPPGYTGELLSARPYRR